MQRISVVIPLFNRQDLVAETLSSIEDQNLLPDEVLVVNDGSTDNSIEVVRRFSESSKLNIKIMENFRVKGVSGAMNSGILSASGELIAFLDSDDLWTPNHLEQLVKALDKFQNVHMAFSGVTFFGKANDVQKNNDDFRNSVEISLKNAFENVEDIWLSNKKLLSTLLTWGFPFRCPASIVRKSFLTKNEILFDEEISYTQDSQFATISAYFTPFIYSQTLGAKIRRHFENDGDVAYGDKVVKSYQKRISGLNGFFRNRKLTHDERRALKKKIFLLQNHITKYRTSNSGFFNKICESLRLFIVSPGIASVKSVAKLLICCDKLRNK